MPRIHDPIGSLTLSDHEATALLELLRRSGETVNDERTKAVVGRLALRCQNVVDASMAAEQGVSLKEYQCPGHVWAYSGTAYGGDDWAYHGEGRCYCENCGADGDG